VRDLGGRERRRRSTVAAIGATASLCGSWLLTLHVCSDSRAIHAPVIPSAWFLVVCLRALRLMCGVPWIEYETLTFPNLQYYPILLGYLRSL